MKDQEARLTAEMQKMKDRQAKEIKKQREAWAAAEKQKRERWVQDKTREIKEITTKGLEPELIRLVTTHKQQVEAIEQEHRQSVKRLKLEMEEQHELKIVGLM
jgi:5-azacytidine-induced protein 1